MVPLETGTGKKKKKRVQETKAVWSREERGQEGLVIVIAIFAIGTRLGFKVQAEVF